MYLFKCDVCKYVQEKGEKFYNVSIISEADRSVSMDLCSECAKPIVNLKNKKEN